MKRRQRMIKDWKNIINKNFLYFFQNSEETYQNPHHHHHNHFLNTNSED